MEKVQASYKRAKVIVTGGTGLVGTHLCQRLQESGYGVAILSRLGKSSDSITSFTWDPDKQTIDPNALDKAEYIIHLAGANIGDKRWTKKRKQEILDSRVRTGELLFSQVNKQNTRLRAFITASAIGYYGAISTDEVYSESRPPSDDFLGATCAAWEELADRFEGIGVRSVKIRTGLVLSKHGGALAKLKVPISLGIGAALGSGKQYMPWIHMDDLCNIYRKAIENQQMHGPYNAVAPEHITNRAFTGAIAHTLRKPLWLPAVPEFLLKLTLGEMSEMLLKGSRVSSEKIVSSGYTYLYPGIGRALGNCLET